MAYAEFTPLESETIRLETNNLERTLIAYKNERLPNLSTIEKERATDIENMKNNNDKLSKKYENIFLEYVECSLETMQCIDSLYKEIEDEYVAKLKKLDNKFAIFQSRRESFYLHLLDRIEKNKKSLDVIEQVKDLKDGGKIVILDELHKNVHNQDSVYTDRINNLMSDSSNIEKDTKEILYILKTWKSESKANNLPSSLESYLQEEEKIEPSAINVEVDKCEKLTTLPEW